MRFFNKRVPRDEIDPEELLNLLKQILSTEKLMLEKENIIMNTIDDVIANVSDEDTVIDSAVVLITGLQTQITALKVGADSTMQAKIDTLNSTITAKKVALAAA